MDGGNRFNSIDEFNLDSKWLVDPNQLFVGPKIGEGAHAKVYEGKYKNRNVAVKIVHRGETPDEIAKREGRFAREVAMLSRVQHKNLVKFIGACKEPVMVIVTELLLGGTLRKYLLNMRPNSLDRRIAIGFALDIARAMECLHAHGIIHRDLKPENLLLTEDYRTVKLADFGLAREESLTEMMTAETGTYRWMAPELYSTVTLRQGEKKHYNHKVDAYSFAIVLWELMHNKLPFEGMSNLQAAYAAAFKNVRPSADDLPEDVALILTSCWNEDPNARPNFTQIIQMLLHYLSTIAPLEPAIPPRIFTRENSILPPESPGTSSLMAKKDSTGETPRTPMENKPRGQLVATRRYMVMVCMSAMPVFLTTIGQMVATRRSMVMVSMSLMLMFLTIQSQMVVNQRSMLVNGIRVILLFLIIATSSLVMSAIKGWLVVSVLRNRLHAEATIGKKMNAEKSVDRKADDFIKGVRKGFDCQQRKTFTK